MAVLVSGCLGLMWGTANVPAAVVSIVNGDGPGEGLNDFTPTAPVGGNNGTTVGQQRLIVFQKAAEIWGNQIQSQVPILVRASFDPLFCTPFSAVLGQAGPVNVFRDFVGAPVANTYFPSALANAFAGVDLDPNQPDIDAFFSSNLGQAGCLTGTSWYYGLDGNEGANQIDLLDTILHEIAHGLGFLTFVNVNTGARLNNTDDHFMRFLEDHSTGRTFTLMTDAERAAASINTGNLHWIGSNVVARSTVLTAGRHPVGHVEMYAPNPTQPGSSVSHFSTSLAPDELMEPFATSSSISTLTVELFKDIGYTIVAAGTPSLSITNTTVVEGNSGVTNAVFTVTLSAPSTNTVQVGYATSNLTAVAGFDFFAAVGTLTFPPGATVQTIPVSVIGDLSIEANETFTVQLFSPTNALLSQSQGLGTILNDDGPVLRVSDVSVAEGDTGFTNATFLVTLTQSAGSSVGVEFFTSNGTATNGFDYFATNGFLFFPAGTQTQAVSVVVFGDVEIEADEVFYLNLTNAVGTTILKAQGQGTIIDEDSRLIVEDTALVEGNSGTTNASFNVRLTKAATNVVTVRYSTSSRTAAAGSDFVNTNGLLTFPVGVTNVTLLVPVIGDLLNEVDESFVVNLSNPTNSFITRGQATCIITNDDAVPGVFITNTVSVTEGNSGTTNAAVTVFLTSASGRVVSVAYATGAGTASPGSDYVASSGSIVFPTNTTSQVINIPVIGDSNFEANETFTVRISNPANATNVVNQDVATVTIVNDDAIPLVGVTDVAVFEGAGGTTTAAVFTVTLSIPSGLPVSVNYTTADLSPAAGAAQAGFDYVSTSGSVTFPPGSTSQSVTVVVNGDDTEEPNEAFFLDLSGPSNALIARSRGFGTILNDDGPILRISDVTLTEGNSGTTNAVFAVTLLPTATSTVTVNYATSNITATAGLDYLATNGVLTFLAGETSSNITVIVNGESFLESDETFAVVLSSAANATIGRAVGTGTIKDDDTLADLGLTVTRSSLVGSGESNFVGHQITYQLAVTNFGPLPATNIVLSSVMPANITLVSWTNSQGTFTANAGNSSFNLGTLASNGFATATMVVSPTATGAFTNVLTLTATQPDTNALNNATNLLSTIITPQVTLTNNASLSLISESVVPANGSFDPAEFVTVALNLLNAGNVAATNLTVSLLSGNGVHSPGAAQNYGALNTNLPTARHFTFTASTAGGTVITTFVLTDGTNSLGTVSFTNATGGTTTFGGGPAMTIPAQGAATPYPSTITVAGLSGVINQLSVTLSNVSHTFPSDIDALLVGPQGQRVILMSDAGGGNALNGVRLVFADSGATLLPEFNPIASGTYKPTEYDSRDVFPSPAPAAPYANTMSAFSGTDPNGIWSLFVVDDANGDAGAIAGGWSLQIETVSPVNNTAALAVSVLVSPDPVREGSNLVYSVTVTNRGPSAATSVILANALPFQSVLASAPAFSQGSVTTNGNTLLLNLGKIASGASVTGTITVINTAAGTATNVADVAGAETDLNLADNRAVTITRINRVVSLASQSSTTLTNGQFGLTLTGVAGLTYVLEVSTNLVDWVPIHTNPPGNGVINFVDPAASSGGLRFYRAIER